MLLHGSHLFSPAPVRTVPTQTASRARVVAHRTLSAVLTLLVVGGCAVTEDDLVAWETTRRGPGRIVAVLTANKYSNELRIRAGLALVEMEPRTGEHAVDGVSELQHTLSSLDEPTRTMIVDGMTPGLLAMMRGEGRAAAPPDSTAPVPMQIRAKDAAFLILQWASPENQSALTDGVVGWFCEDFNGRNLAGSFSAEQVVRGLGARAASRLVDAITARIPSAALVQITNLIAQIGDDATKELAGTRLVAVEREMEGPEFAAWLEERFRAQIAAQGLTRTEDQIHAGVEQNRELYITEGALPAMKNLAESVTVANRLLEIASVTTFTAPMTAVTLEERRVRALMALEGHTRPDQVQPLLAMALLGSNPARVRDYAFDRIGDSHDRGVLPQLWPLATQDGSASATAWRERWRVGSLLLTLGGTEIVAEWFTRLPATAGTGRDAASVRYAREELHGYAERLAQMRPLEPVTAIVRTRLTSTRWFDQVVAIYFYERTGGSAELALLQPLTASTTPTVGDHWEEHGTIGAIATAAIAAIQERLADDAATAAAAAPTTPSTPAAPAGGTAPAAPAPTTGG